jgi:acyl dehydratase
MTLNDAAVGATTTPVEVSWTSDETLLYALAVGAGRDDPHRDLAFTTENSVGIVQGVLPTFGAVIVQRARSSRPSIGDVHTHRGLHQRQSVRLDRTLSPAGSALVETTVAGIYDGGFGALAVYESTVRDRCTGDQLLTAVTTEFLRGEAGFGPLPCGESWTAPLSPPDVEATVAIRPEQALLYRLCGDRNPLHSDPGFARRCGFSRPILHGLCTFGAAGLALLHGCCESDPARVATIDARFSRRVRPGDRLTVRAWHTGDHWRFIVVNGEGKVVVDEGRLDPQPAATAARPARPPNQL